MHFIPKVSQLNQPDFILSSQITPEQLSALKADLQHLRERLFDLSQQAQRISDFIVTIAEPPEVHDELDHASQDEVRQLKEITLSDSWTFRRPVDMRIGQHAELIPVRSWRDVIRNTFALLKKEHPQAVRGFILQRAATNPAGYGSSPEAMQSPYEVDVGLFVNLGQSANAFRKELRDLIRFAGAGGISALKIRVESDPEENGSEDDTKDVDLLGNRTSC